MCEEDPGIMCEEDLGIRCEEDLGICEALLNVEEELVERCLAPSCCERKDCNSYGAAFDSIAACYNDIGPADIGPIKSLLQVLLDEADYLQNQLVDTQDLLQRESLGALVPSFLYNCHPFFKYLESRARSRLTQKPAATSSSTLLEFSQQLFKRLEQLVLIYAHQGVISVDESQFDSLSHLYIGQCQIDRLKVSVFRYFMPMPFLSAGGTPPGLYKRMRWNVERLADDRLHHSHPHHHQQEEQSPEEELVEKQPGTGGDTQYFFLCYEDVPVPEAGINRDEERLVAICNHTSMWSIGRWMQTYPNTETEDVYEWVLCEVPQAKYLKLVSLGSEEPSAHHATDCLLGVLFPQQTLEFLAV